MQQPQRPTVSVPSGYPQATSSYTSTQGPMSTVSSTTPFLAAGASQYNTNTNQYNPYPDTVNPANPYFNPSATTGGPSSVTSGSGSGGVMPGPGPLRAQNPVMSDPDVDRIAARVANMIAGSGSPGATNPPADTFEAPPPTYNEKSGLH